MQRHLLNILVFSIIVSIVIMSLPTSGELGATPNDVGNTDELQNIVPVEEDSTSDGPHVFWESDSSAIVFYFCNEAVDKKQYRVGDTLKFNGFCGDSITEYLIPAALPEVGPCIFENVPKVMALSDIHGEFEFLTEILVKSGVVDNDLRWIWANGHLVIVGDIFDRGDKVTECLWLIYRLGREAEQHGGQVHFILGNHELMVLRGDDRYIHEKYIQGIVKKSRILHKDLYGPDMELGRWLRTLHVAIKINDIIFVHGGLSPFLIQEYTVLNDLNQIVRENIDLRSSQLAFNEKIRFLFGSKGPFWYRGYHYEMEDRYPMAMPEEIANILEIFEGSSIVVGHTEVDQVSALYDGRVFAIDVPFDELGSLQGLLWKDGEFYLVSGEGELLTIE